MDAGDEADPAVRAGFAVDQNVPHGNLDEKGANELREHRKRNARLY
jgi:hypothetical protein